jgi:hypothetical protein
VKDPLCPRCGAYWGCDCPRDDLFQPSIEGCDHDWVEAVGVEVLDELDEYLCRLCGLYAVRMEAA